MIEQCYNNEIDTWLINANISVMFFGVIVSNKCRIKNYSIMLCVDLPPDYIDYFSFTLNLKLIIRFSEEFRNSLNDDRKSEDTLMADTSFSGTNVLFLTMYNDSTFNL